MTWDSYWLKSLLPALNIKVPKRTASSSSGKKQGRSMPCSSPWPNPRARRQVVVVKWIKQNSNNSGQRFSWVFAALGLLLFLAVNFAAFGNRSTQTLCKSDIPSNRSKDLSSARVFQMVKVYWDSKRFKMLLGMQYGALYSHVYQMVALNKRHQLATNASKWRDSGSEVAETFRSSLPETPFSSPVPIHTHRINCSGPLSPKTLVPTACCPPSKYSLGWENAHQKFSSKHFWRHSWLILTVISG